MNIIDKNNGKASTIAHKNLPALDMELLKSFVAIAEHGNFTKAAEQVFRTPSAISMQIKRLEEILETSVFNRDSRSVKLTQDGDMLLGYARRLLALNGEIMGKFLKPDMVGMVTIGAPSDYGMSYLPNILKRFFETHPQVTVNVVVQNSKIQRQMLKDNELDIAIVTAREEEENDPNIIELKEDQLSWVGLKGGCAYEKRPLPISVWECGCIWRKNTEEALAKKGIEFRVAYKSENNIAQQAAAKADLALAVLPKSAVSSSLMIYDESHGLPKLDKFKTIMLHQENLNCAAEALKDHVITSFEEIRYKVQGQMK